MAIAGDHFMLNRVTEVGQETRCGVIHALSIRQLPICLILTSITQWTLINGLSKDYPVYNVAEMPLPWRDTGRSYMLSRAWDGNHMAVICLFPEIALSSVEWQLVYGGSLDSEHRFREVKHWADQLIITLAFVGIESHTGRRPQYVVSVQKISERGQYVGVCYSFLVVARNNNIYGSWQHRSVDFISFHKYMSLCKH